jgi:hypothetical protein
MITKIIGLLLVSLTLISCSPRTDEVTGDFIMPEGMDDCQIHRLTDGNIVIRVVRCPNSSTTTTTMTGR